MNRLRVWFFVALTLFAAWVAALGWLAIKTSEAPQAKMVTGGDMVR